MLAEKPRFIIKHIKNHGTGGVMNYGQNKKRRMYTHKQGLI